MTPDVCNNDPIVYALLTRYVGKPVGCLPRFIEMQPINRPMADGRRLGVLTYVDDHSGECLTTEAGTTLPGASAVQVVEQVSSFIGSLETIVVDNGPEFAG